MFQNGINTPFWHSGHASQSYWTAQLAELAFHNTGYCCKTVKNCTLGVPKSYRGASSKVVHYTYVHCPILCHQPVQVSKGGRRDSEWNWAAMKRHRGRDAAWRMGPVTMVYTRSYCLYQQPPQHLFVHRLISEKLLAQVQTDLLQARRLMEWIGI